MMLRLGKIGSISAWIIGVATLLGLSGATESLSTFAENVWIYTAWITWSVGVFLLLVPSVIGLVYMRTLTPVAAIASAVALIAASDASSSDRIFLGIGFAGFLCSLAITYSSEFSEIHVNGSAYGSERRFVLRPPANLLLPAFIGWLFIVVPLATTLISLSAKNWLVFIVSLAITGPMCAIMPMRLAKLATRWLVIVPAGLVVHDKVVLAETVMFRNHMVTEVKLAPANTESADLTGVTWGIPLQISVNGGDKIVFTPDKDHPRGKAIHANSILVAPTRPGRFLSTWQR